MPRLDGQVLLVDADDTLWENESYFRRMLEVFLDLTEMRGHTRPEAAHRLRRIEGGRCRRLGYGSRNFAASLVETVRELEGTVGDRLRDELEGMGRWIREHPVEVFPRVRETLEALRSRHRLLLVTKGQQDEQAAKIRRSGLDGYFETAEILPEKDAARYRELVRIHGLAACVTWMVGNSPRSDVNPARAAGLRTVYIPHRSIWEFEAEELDGEPDLRCTRFYELTRHF